MRPTPAAASITALLAALASGCADDGADDGPRIANPASEYCVAQGGEVEIVDEADGQVGYCNLPDGRRIEEWELYNAATEATTP